MNSPRFPTTIGNVVLTGRHIGEESVHTYPRHLDHSELLTPDISLHPDDHSCSKPENDLMESWTRKHGYVKIHFILVLKCVSSCQLYTVHSYSESKVVICFEPANINLAEISIVLLCLFHFHIIYYGSIAQQNVYMVYIY